MKELLKKYENKQPEIVFHWKDPDTEAEGWAVINSLARRCSRRRNAHEKRVGSKRSHVLGKNDGGEVYRFRTCNRRSQIGHQFRSQ